MKFLVKNEGPNRQQRRMSGKKKSFAPAKSAAAWVSIISNIATEDDLKQFESLINQQCPKNIPMTTIRKAMEARLSNVTLQK